MEWFGLNSDQSLSSLTQIDPTLCTPTSPTYLAGGRDKIWRKIQMPTNRKFSAIRIELDFYYIEQMNEVQTMVYLNQVIISETLQSQSFLSTPTSVIYCNRPASNNTADSSAFRLNYFNEFRESQIEIFIEQIGLQPIKIYALSGFYLYVQFCDLYCEICNEQGQCERCQEGLKLIEGQCNCSYNGESYNSLFQLDTPNIQCLNSCPIGYVPDTQGICQSGISNLLFQDLFGDFNTYLFYIIKDKYYSNLTDNSNRIAQIGNQKMAGPFFYNEQIAYSQLSIIGNSEIMIKLRIYFLRYQQSKQVGGQICLKFNNYTVLQIYDYSYPVLHHSQGTAHVNNIQICNFQQSDNCYQSDIYFQMYLDYEINEITFEGQFTIIQPLRGWCLSNFEILEQQITTSVYQCIDNCLTCPFRQPKSCISCKSGYFKFANKCLIKCPLQTMLIGNECVENGMSGQFDYILNILYDDNNYQDEIQNLSQNYEGQLSKTSKFMYNSNIYSVLGGFSIWSYEQISHLIKNDRPFYKAFIKLNVVCIDLIFNEIFQIFVNVTGVTYKITTATPNLNEFKLISVGNIMGSAQWNEYIAEVFIEFASFQSIDNLLLTFSISQFRNQSQYYGIFNYRVMVLPCPQFCNQCDSSGNCQNWIKHISLESGNCAKGYFYDYQFNSCSQCLDGCYECSNSYQCIQCFPKYSNIHGQCYCSTTQELSNTCTYKYPCNKGCLLCGYNIEDNLNKIQRCLICDESNHYWMNINKCSCLEGYYMEDQICQPCSELCQACHQYPRLCTKCDPSLNRILKYQQCECLFGYYSQESFKECFKCNITCKTCQLQSTVCTSCYIDQFRNLLENQCLCKDGYFDSGNEICTECDKICKTCLDIITCSSCYQEQNRKLNLNNTKCICEIGYYEIENKLECVPCHFSCQFCQNSDQNNMCIRCPITREPSTKTTIFSCICKRGYYESNMMECLDCRNYQNPPDTHYCYSKCGDNIIQWNEDCDDGNHNQKDECSFCIFSHSYCQNPLCKLCQMGQCQNCIDGYFLNQNNQCEQCDQSCQTCKNKSNDCLICNLLNENDLTCIICDSRQGFQLKDGKCINICGDGQRVINEECDDGNQFSNDGCYNCLIENDWICEDICQQINYPYLIFEENPYNNLFQEQRNLIFKSSIPLKSQSSFLDICQFSTKNDQQKIEILQLQDLTDYFDEYVILKIHVQILLKDKNENPILICSIKNPQNYQSKQGITFKQQIFYIQLLKYLKPTQQVINATESLIYLNKYVLYILLGLALLSIIVGGLHIFWNLLDVLQLISYFQFFNILYPYNVDTYFQLFDFAQFDFLKVFLSIEDLVNSYVISPEPHYKFVLKGYSSTFYINAFTVFITFMTTLSIYIFCIIGFKIVTKLITYYTSDNLYIDYEPNFIKYLILRIIRYVQKILLKIIYFLGSGFLRTFMSVAYDYNLAIFLQLQTYNIQNSFLTSSLIMSVLFFSIQVVFIFQGFSIMNNHPYHFKQQQVIQKYGAIFESIKIRESKPYSKFYNLILLCKKVFFIFILVFCYCETLFTILTCSLLNVAFIIYLQFNKPLEDIYEHYKIIGSEIIIFLVEIVIVILFCQQKKESNEDNEILIGWFIITLCTFLILFQFFLDVKQHFDYLIKIYQVLRNIISRIKNYFTKPLQAPQESKAFLEQTTKSQQIILEQTIQSQKSQQFKSRKVVTFRLDN
ncbi:unnamed protein product [Paramecium sonneborni]|uniref:EGF-like domain-containing protein n=1 Tax=Paramecium sonneborni TaxID=65129 RepID=A0A8S1LS06_9CILI|nr:unnamed protein product [Paramecium sonneborni]